jgi:peptide/nickel transport system ATP-binding protein
MSLLKDFKRYIDVPDEEYVMLVRDLTKYFPIRRGITDVIFRRPQRYVRAVDHIDLDIPRGKIISLVGESGCGKTTTGMTLIRLYDPTGGAILFRPKESTLEELRKISNNSIEDVDGYVDISTISSKYLKPLRKDMQIVFQDPYSSLNPAYRVYNILEEPLKVHGIGESDDERRDMIYKALEEVKLVPAEDIASRFPHMLSGGQRQRVVLARALLLNPKFIVADEPIAMIDVSLRAEILLSLLDLKERHNISILFITHDLTIAGNISDYIAVMYLGKVVEIGEVDKLVKNPLHPYTKALMKAIPVPDPSMRRKLKDIWIKGEVPDAVNIPSGCRFHPRCRAYDEHPEVRDMCRREEPHLIEAEKGHYVSCWLYK